MIPLVWRMVARSAGFDLTNTRALRSSSNTPARVAAAALRTVDSPESNSGNACGSPSATTAINFVARAAFSALTPRPARLARDFSPYVIRDQDKGRQ